MSTVGASLDRQHIPMNIRNRCLGVRPQLRLGGVFSAIIKRDRLNAR